MVSGIVLAGGRSTRMGVDKTMLAVLGVPLLRRALTLLDPLTDEVVVVTHDRNETVEGVRYVADELRDRGPMAGLLTGLRAMTGAKGVVIPVDLPLLPPALLTHLVETSAGWDVTIPRWREGLEPLVGVYTAACAPALAASLEQGRDALWEFVHHTDLQVRFLEEPEVRRFGDPALLFFNVNTPEDVGRAEALLAPASEGRRP